MRFHGARIFAVLTVLATVRLATVAHAQSDDVATQVTEVQTLTGAGRLEEAEALLRTLEVPDAMRARLRGVIALARLDYAAAAKQFERATRAEKEAGQEADPQLSLYLAHAYVELGRFDDAVTAAQKSAALSDTLVGQPLVLAHALRGARRDAEALEVLRRAAQRFPEESAPWLELVALSSAHALRTLARQQAERLLSRDIDRETTLALIHALHQDGLAMPLLERAAARFPLDAEVRAHLAHGYVAQREWYAAGLLFEQATMLGGEYAFEAADQFRLAGATRRALAMNARVEEAKRRLLQRLSILFAAGETARVVALEAELERYAVDDPVTIYRLAYAHMDLHQSDQAARLARRLFGTSYESQAKALLEGMGRSAGPDAP